MAEERRPYTEQEDKYIQEHYVKDETKEIAKVLCRTVKSVRKRARRIGCQLKKPVRRWTKEDDEIILASNGKKLADVAMLLGRDPSDLSKRARLLGAKCWKRPDGGYYIDSHGYAVDHFENGTPKPVHRVIAEEMIGRPLKNDEVVHHINLDKTDNRKENLHVFQSVSQHVKCHWSLYKLSGKEESTVIKDLQNGKIVFDRISGTYMRSN